MLPNDVHHFMFKMDWDPFHPYALCKQYYRLYCPKRWFVVSNVLKVTGRGLTLKMVSRY